MLSSDRLHQLVFKLRHCALQTCFGTSQVSCLSCDLTSGGHPRLKHNLLVEAIKRILYRACSVNVLKEAVATPGSAQQEMINQEAEKDFILRNFLESVCRKFQPSSSDKSVILSALSS